jgi:hypothetical protein
LVIDLAKPLELVTFHHAFESNIYDNPLYKTLIR